jgi:two-component system chemotaxis response regulator CheY
MKFDNQKLFEEVRPRVLVVEDSLLMANRIKKVIEKLGYEVVGHAKDGIEAIDEFKVLMPDIVTMDITMPVMNGIQAYEVILKHYPCAKIIIISSCNQKKIVLDALFKGVKHFVVKPFTDEKIREVIENVLIQDSMSIN